MKRIALLLVLIASQAYGWTQRATYDFFPCTSGQGNAGAPIEFIDASWINVSSGGLGFACNGGANGATGLNASGGFAIYYWNFSFLSDQYSSATITAIPTGTSSVGVAVRVSSDGANYYALYFHASDGKLRLTVSNSTSETIINDISKSYSNGTKVRLEAIGSGSSTRLTAYEDTGSGFTAVWSSVDPGGTYVDGGKAGIMGSSGGPSDGELDDFDAGDQAAAASSTISGAGATAISGSGSTTISP